MSYTTIKYNEGSRECRRGQIEYHGIEVSYGPELGKIKVFNSGDFVRDWYYRVKFIITEIGTDEHHTCSSSVHHFIMDGAPYNSAYLKTTKKTAKLLYGSEFDRNRIEFFVPKDTRPTWDELRTLCEDTIENPKTA